MDYQIVWEINESENAFFYILKFYLNYRSFKCSFQFTLLMKKTLSALSKSAVFSVKNIFAKYFWPFIANAQFILGT